MTLTDVREFDAAMEEIGPSALAAKPRPHGATS
jgi:hypothetical protein